MCVFSVPEQIHVYVNIRSHTHTHTQADARMHARTRAHSHIDTKAYTREEQDISFEDNSDINLRLFMYREYRQSTLEGSTLVAHTVLEKKIQYALVQTLPLKETMS